MSDQGQHLLIVVEESDSTVGFYDSADGSEVARVRVGFWPHEVALSPDERLAYVTNFGVKDYDETIGRPGHSISIIDIEAKCEVGRLYTEVEGVVYRAPHGIKVRPRHNQLYVNTEAGPAPALLVYDLESGVEGKAKFAVASAKSRVLHLPAVALPGFEKLRMADETAPTATPQKAVTAIKVKRDDSDAQLESSEGAESDGDGQITLPPPSAKQLPRGAHNLLFSPDGAHLWVFPALKIPPFGGQPTWSIVRIDPDTGDVTGHIITRTPVRGLVYTPDGKLVASGRDEIYILNSDSLKIERTIGKLGVDQMLYPAVTPDGCYILAPAVWQSQVIVIDYDTGRVVERLYTGIDPIQVVVAPDGVTAYATHGRSAYLAKINLDQKPPRVEGRIPTRGGPNGLAITALKHNPERAQKPDRAILRVGATLPLSGANFNEGREICLGYEFWKEMVNASGGVMVGGKPHLVETVYRDNRSPLPNEMGIVEKQARELVEEEKVHFLLGTYPSPPHILVADVAEKNQVPFLTATGAGEKIYEYRTYTFGLMSPARVYLQGTLEALARLPERERPRTVTFLSCTDFAALEDARRTAVLAREMGLKLVPASQPADWPKPNPFGWDEEGGLLTFPDQTTKFEKALKWIAEKYQPDLFFSTGHLPESQSMTIQMKESGFKPKGIGFSVGPSLSTFRSSVVRGGGSPGYLFGPAQWHEALPLFGHDRFGTPAEFARAFFERFSMPASYFSAGAMACGLVLEDALRRADSLDGPKVRDALAETNLPTMFARIRFNKRGFNENKPMITIQLQPDGAGGWAETVLWPLEYSAEGASPIWPFPGWQ